MGLKAAAVKTNAFSTNRSRVSRTWTQRLHRFAPCKVCGLPGQQRLFVNDRSHFDLDIRLSNVTDAHPLNFVRVCAMAKHWTGVVASFLLCLGTGTAAGAPVTFFGEDLNPGGDPGHLTSFPNSTAARNAFFSNLSAVGTESFEGIATGTVGPTVSFAVPGGSVTATLSGGTVESGPTSSNQYATSGTKYLNVTTGSYIAKFSSPISAFGFYGVDIGDFGAQLTLSLTDTAGVVTVITVPHKLGACTGTPCSDSTSGSVIYEGFYDTGDTYTSVSFTDPRSAGSDVFGFDDFSVGTLPQVTPVPEPAAVLLLGVGVVGAMVSRRKKRA